MTDKRTTLDEAVSSIESGMTIGIGGWGSRRKPMAFVRALLRTEARDLTVVTYGGPDIGLLCSAGKVKRVYYGFVSLDSPPFYDPWFAKARTSGAIEAREMDEGMLRCGLQAAAQRLPFLPIRAGLGSDVRAFWGDELRTVTSPYPTDGGYEELIAMPALRVAHDIAAKDTRVIRAAKEALNLIDVQKVNSSYRMEQGFTFELNLAGVADEHRDAFAGTTKGKNDR